MQNKELLIISQTEQYGYIFNEIETNGEGLFLRHILKPGQILFDVGANAGDWGRYAFNIQPNVHMFSFEPVPNIYRQLEANLKSYQPNLYNKAISNYVGKGDFFSTEDFEYGWSSFINRPDFKSRGKVIQVEVDTLDNFCHAHQVPHIDILKIDVEGSELSVLKGAQQLLKDNKIKIIQFEYGGTFADAGITLREVMQLLTERGYILFRIFTHGLIHISDWKPNLENFSYCNYVAIKQALIPPQYSPVVF